MWIQALRELNSANLDFSSLRVSKEYIENDIKPFAEIETTEQILSEVTLVEMTEINYQIDENLMYKTKNHIHNNINYF